MTRRRFLADEFSQDHAILLGDHADHLVRALRARVGQEFDIAVGTSVRRGQITSVKDDRVDFELYEEISTVAVPELTLLLAIYKFDRMEWAIEKCTELGVFRIVPLISSRTDSHLASAAVKRAERWQRIARQASEQSRRIAPPEIHAPIKLSDALNFPATQRVLLSESEEQVLLRDVLKTESPGSIALAIGPEGGWAEEEINSFQKSGWQSASLGQTILRAETAAIAATAIAISALY
jgi:16S rRNA (uracil1498-N3)-methyltransferase